MVASPGAPIRLVAQRDGHDRSEVVDPDDGADYDEIEAEFHFHHPVEDTQSEHRKHPGRKLPQT
jgi:hypothetical protein